MSDFAHRSHEPLPRIAEKTAGSDEECTQPPVLPMRLRKGIREALAGKHGQLRMDPEDLAVLIGAAIDMEIERLHRVRKEWEAKQRTKRMLAAPSLFFAPEGTRGIWEKSVE